MYFKNARIFGPDFQFHNGAFEVREGKFGLVLPNFVPQNAVDLDGAVVIPGLIDIHNRAPFSSGGEEGLYASARRLAELGVTSFVPTVLPYQVKATVPAAKQLREDSPAGHSRLMGIHLESQSPDFESFQALCEDCDGLIRLVDVAPELPGAAKFIEKASRLCALAIQHTESSYDDAKKAFHSGAAHLTQLYNAAPPIHHRDPGVLPAAVENPKVRAELVCDGASVHPSYVRLAFSMFGSHRMILVSDASSPPAENLFECMKNAILFGVPEADAIRACTYNPACALGIQDRVGTIAPGHWADFIVCRSDFSNPRVFLGGEEI